MTQPGSNKKVANSLVSASCAAVLAVYTTGYIRTRTAAERFTTEIAHRRVPAPNPSATAPPPADAVAAPTPIPAPTRPLVAHEAPHKPMPVASAASEPIAPSLPSGPAEPVPAEMPAPVPEPIAILAAAPVPPAPPVPTWKDGTYTGWGYSRHGNIEAEVVIESGRILSAAISQCRTRYSCNVIEKLPPEVAQRQSPDVDYVSGATQSADAFYGAVVEALRKAK